jgi:RNA polymerase sigma-70 factor (ECF subfamily)
VVNLSDEALAARVVHGDVTAFTALYDRYERRVYVLAAHLLGPASAEDVVQELFLRLWHKAPQFDPARGSFRQWFLASARHAALAELRRRSLRQQRTATGEIERLLADAADPRHDVEEEGWRRARHDAIRGALATLPAEQRAVLVLAYFGGLSQSAMAEQLGWPLGTVKKRTRLAMQKLRRSLQHVWREEDATGAPRRTGMGHDT